MWRNSVKLRLTLTGKATSYSLAGGFESSILPFRPLQWGREMTDYSDLEVRPEDAPKPSTKASVPSSEDSRALTSRNRA